MKLLKLHRGTCCKWCLIFLSLFFTVTTASGQNTPPAGKKRYNVLILNSYHKGYFWSDTIMEAIEREFKHYDLDTELYIEYMDIKRNGNRISEYFPNYYRAKYKNIKIDVIISSDEDGLLFIQQYREELFPEIPIVFCGIFKGRLGEFDLEKQSNITGVVEIHKVKSTVELALRLHKGAKKLMIVSNIDNNEYFKSLITEHKDVSVENIIVSRLNRAQFIDRLQQISKDSVVFLSGASRDLEGNIYKIKPGTELIRKNCNAPIYGIGLLRLGHGIVGGNITDAEGQGIIAAQLAARILRGDHVDDIEIVHDVTDNYMFDYNQLKYFGIAESALPKTRTIINKPVSFYDQNKKWLFLIAFIVSGLTTIVIVLLINILKRKKAENELHKAKGQLEAKVEERTCELITANEQLKEEIHERRLAQNKLLDYQKQLKSLASELSLTEERERRRIATELHDRINQSLVISKVKLDSLRETIPVGDTAETIKDVCELLDNTIQDTKYLTFDLSSPILYELGFEAAVSEWLNEQIEQKHGIKSIFKDDGQAKELDEDIQVLLFRTIRELLINVVKHSSAEQVSVFSEKDNGLIKISVEDNGVGFNPSEVTGTPGRNSGFGLFSIRERLEHLGGYIRIESECGQGCKVIVTAPLKKNQESQGE